MFPLPTADNNPTDLTAGPDGNLWLTQRPTGGKLPGAIGRITPAGAIAQFPLPTAGSIPGNLKVGPDGNLWFLAIRYHPSGIVGSRPGSIGRITLKPRQRRVVAVAQSRVSATSILPGVDEALNPASARRRGLR
jgi:virginiamycin B lyase